MRCDQFIGLSGKAEEWLHENCAKVTIRTVKETRSHRLNIISESVNEQEGFEYDPSGSLFGYYPAFGYDDEEVKLSSYTLKDGRVVYEKVQASPWSSGPMYFTALAWKNGEFIHATLWDESEFNNY